MTRSIWKGPFFKPFNFAAQSASLEAPELRTMARKWTFHVYNGKKFLPVKVTQEMIGFRLGDFSFSKKPAVYRIESKNPGGAGGKRGGR